MRVGLALVFACLATTAQAASWAETTETDYPVSKAICQTLKPLKLPMPPQKSAAACDSEDLYYGIKHPADPAAARLCALSHIPTKAEDETDPFDGRALLVTIYANGRGATRNLDIASAYACLLDGAPAEIDARILHLAAMKASPKPEPFGFCDDATSTILLNQCGAHDAAAQDVVRKKRLAALAATLAPEPAAALAKLRKAEAAFVAARGDNEVDQSGTIRVVAVLGEQETQQDAFVKTLEAVAGGRGPTADAAKFKAADAALNAAYGKVMRVKDTASWGTTDKAGIKTTQKAWLAYRDAFVALASVVPGASIDGVKANLTDARTTMLAAFLE
ncbi:lysozyme inhibitor LprI family protein [Beijerinckia sp. L45]|uniref:lysozyme inhibitor LprI family protein n=1 Tax=Beijerinckia sp. L45 TaxID=1641855 RepID=UPI00131BAB35|nr:lysozyme inhibitor LprI family protein [Beijerinckia sp. L45]